MRGRTRITVEVDGSIFAIRGYRAHGFALGAGLRPTYNGVRGAWVADTKRLPDFIACLQRRNVPVEVVDLTRVESFGQKDATPVSGDTDAPLGAVDPQLSLFDGSR